MDRLGDEMTSLQLSRWEAYFHAVHELGAEASAAMSGERYVAEPPPRTPEEEEHELRTLFRLHNARLAGEA